MNKMKNTGNKNKYLRNALIYFIMMLLCCAALLSSTYILVKGNNDTEPGSQDLSDSPVEDKTLAGTDGNTVPDTVDGTYATLSRAEFTDGVPAVITDNLYANTVWSPGTERTEKLAVCNGGSMPLAYEILLYVINDNDDFSIAPDLILSLSGSHNLETNLSDAHSTVVARSDTMIQPGEVRNFDITLSLPASAQQGSDSFSLCLILGALDDAGNTVVSITGDRLDYVPVTVPANSEILLGSTSYTLRQQSGTVQSGLKFTGKGDTSITLDDTFADDGLTVYMKDCGLYNLNLYLPAASIFNNCDFRTENSMSITADLQAQFDGCRFDKNVVVNVPNQEAGSLPEFTNCVNEPAVVKR